MKGGLKIHMRRQDANNPHGELGVNLKDSQGNPAHMTLGANPQTLSEEGDTAHGIRVGSTGYASTLASGNTYTTTGDVDNPVHQTSLVRTEDDAETNQPAATTCQNPNHKAVKAYATDPNTVVIEYDDGCEQVRSGGTLSWRNNNPGNVTLLSATSRIHGAIGFNLSRGDLFAIYPDEETGLNTIVSVLQESQYQTLTLNGAFYKYAPPKDHNNTPAYVRFVVQKTGIPPETPMNSLNQAQMLSIANAIKIHEGWRPGAITWKQGEN